MMGHKLFQEMKMMGLPLFSEKKMTGPRLFGGLEITGFPLCRTINFAPSLSLQIIDVILTGLYPSGTKCFQNVVTTFIFAARYNVLESLK